MCKWCVLSKSETIAAATATAIPLSHVLQRFGSGSNEFITGCAYPISLTFHLYRTLAWYLCFCPLALYCTILCAPVPVPGHPAYVSVLLTLNISSYSLSLLVLPKPKMHITHLSKGKTVYLCAGNSSSMWIGGMGSLTSLSQRMVAMCLGRVGFHIPTYCMTLSGENYIQTYLDQVSICTTLVQMYIRPSSLCCVCEGATDSHGTSHILHHPDTHPTLHSSFSVVLFCSSRTKDCLIACTKRECNRLRSKRL